MSLYQKIRPSLTTQHRRQSVTITMAAMEPASLLPATSSAQLKSDDNITVASGTDRNDEFNDIAMVPLLTDTITAPVQYMGTVVPPKHDATKTKWMPRTKHESKTIFLEDPMQTVPLSIDRSDL
jgi:hypothetical protein